MSQSAPMKAASSVSLGVTVLLLYALFVTAVFSGFATYIYRTQWEAHFAADVGAQAQDVTDLDTLIFVVKRETALDAERKALRDRRIELEADKASLQAEYNIAIAQISLVKSERERQASYDLKRLEDIQTLLPVAEQRKFEDFVEVASTDRQQTASNALKYLQDTAPRTDLNGETLQQLEDTLAAVQLASDKLNARHVEHTEIAHQAKGKMLLIDQQLAQNMAETTSKSAQLQGLRDKVPPGSADRARLAALSTSVPLVGDMFQRLVSFPTIFLTLIVTIAAGGLGTVVAFSRRYYSPEGKGLTMSRLFVNVGEGIAAAIAIFLFSGAGMLALTQGGGAQNEVELSPYTVAFVAFLSGFMAEDAFAAIQTAGKRIFNREDKDGDGGGAAAA